MAVSRLAKFVSETSIKLSWSAIQQKMPLATAFPLVKRFQIKYYRFLQWRSIFLCNLYHFWCSNQLTHRVCFGYSKLDHNYITGWSTKEQTQQVASSLLRIAELRRTSFFGRVLLILNEAKYSRMDQVKFVEDSLWKILFDPFLNIFPQMLLLIWSHWLWTGPQFKLLTLECIGNIWWKVGVLIL